MKEYFSHDYNTRQDEKVKRLIMKEGMLGYGIFWSIVENLYNNANALRLEYDIIAFELHVDTDIVKRIINEYDLFIINGVFFGSESVERRLNERVEKSKKASESAIYRWSKQKNDANAMQTQCNSNAIKENKIKKNKIKDTNNTCFSFDEFWDMYAKKIGREKCEHKYKTILESDRAKIKSTLPKYLETIEDKQYQKNPQTYLNGKHWEDEIIIKKPLKPTDNDHIY